MVAFIDAHREAYGVEPICAQLPIAPSTYYEVKARQADPTRVPRRTERDAQLKPEIERVWKDNRRCTARRKSGSSSIGKPSSWRVARSPD
jgi:putative transposase